MFRKFIVLVVAALLFWWVGVPLLGAVWKAAGFLLGLIIHLATLVFLILLVAFLVRILFGEKSKSGD